MVQASTYLYAPIVIVLIVTTVWQCAEQISYYLEEPVKISIFQKAVAYKEFGDMIVCSTTWAAENLKAKGTDIDVIQYAMGFITNSNLQNLPKSYAWDLARNQTRYLAAKASFEAEQKKSGFSYRNFTVSKSGMVQVQVTDQYSKNVFKTLPMAPFHVGDQVLCTNVSRYAGSFALSLTKLESFTDFPFFERPSFRLLMPSTDILAGKGPMSISITFYDNPYWSLLSPNRHFLKYTPPVAVRNGPLPNDPLAVAEVSTQLNIHKYINLNSRRHPCKPVESRARYPIGFGMRVCEILCEEVAINAVYGCSSLSLLDIPNKPSHLPACNIFDYLYNTKQDKAFSKFSEVDKIKQICQNKSGCQDKKFCIEWKVKFSSTSASKRFVNKEKELNTSIPGEYHNIDVAIPPIMTVSIEDKLMKWEGFLGSLGGIVGMWLGSSVLALAHFLINIILEWRKQKIEDTSGVKVDKN